MTTPEQIDKWCSIPTEHATLEFKEAKNTFSLEKLYEYAVAIANEGGGHLVLGMTNSPPRQVVGSQALANPVKTIDQCYQKLGFCLEITPVDHPDGRVVVVTIPERPRGTAYQIDGRYLMRTGESLTAMSADKLRSIFSEGQPNWLAEPARTLSAQEVIDQLDMQSFFELLGEPFPTKSAAVLDRLERERLATQSGGNFELSRLACLLLARRLPDFPEVQRKAPRVVVYSGRSKLETKLDQVGLAGYAAGFRRLIQFIMSQLPQNEIVEDAIRREAKLLPELAIRELVANALIHQDFGIGGTSVMIEIYSDRVAISNPGSPIVELNRFIDGYQSRNEQLADLMRRLGICEEKGSGIDRVIEAAEVFQLPAPEFREEFHRTSAVLAGPKPLEKMARDERIRACYQHAGLRRVMGDYMTNQSLRERFKLPGSKSATVSQVITATLDEQLIKTDESIGSSRKLRRYLPYWA